MAKAGRPRLTGPHLVRALWRLIRIYWSSSDAKWGALLLLGAIALELGTVRAQLFLAEAQGQTWDALETRETASFFQAVTFLVASMALFVIASTYRTYLRQALEIRWRRLLTAHYLGRWMNVQAYCQVELHRGEIDNPDQRVAEDVRDFVASALGLSLSLLAAVATLVSLRRAALGPLAGLAAPAERQPGPHPRLHALGGARLLAALHVADPPRRAAARPHQLRQAALRGRLPLRPDALPRQRRARAAVLPRRRRRAERLPRAASRASSATSGS